MKATIEILARVVAAVAIVTGAYYVWQLPQQCGDWAVLVTYAVFALLLLIGAFVALRIIVRRDYQRYHRLTPLSTGLECVIAGLYLAFPTIYSPPNWAWFWSNDNLVSLTLKDIGSILIVIGLTVIVIAMAWLGLPRSWGQRADALKMSGPYRVSRNPQILGGALLIVGVFLLQPSWYASGWIILCAALLHMMVLTEEEHLRERFGKEYDRYMKRVPRYLGTPKWGGPK